MTPDLVVIWPVFPTTLKDTLSVPPSSYIKMGSFSGSVAVTGAPTLTPAPEFSGMLRVVLSLPNSGGSFTFVKLIVTEMSSVPPFPSDAVTVTE